MRTLYFLGCGAIAAACATNKPAQEPAHVSQSDPTTVTQWPADSPERMGSPHEDVSNGPSDSPPVVDRDDTPHAPTGSTAGGANFSTMGTPASVAPETASRPDADNSR